MKAFRILSRDIRDAFKSVFRNFSLSLASISCITITLLVVAISVILSSNVNNFATLVEKDMTIVAFLDLEITNDDRQAVADSIALLDNIESVKFKSKSEIAHEMMESSKEFESALSNWTEEESPIQDTYLVKVQDIEQIGKTAKEIEKMQGVSIVKYGEGMVEQLISVFNIVRNITVGMVIALIIVTAFLIANTIKITIFSRKREIEIMRLVGSSNINIKIPFMMEGLFLGIIGSIIPIITMIYGYVALYEHFDGQMFSPFIQLIQPQPFVYEVSIFLLFVGALVGMIGSWRAVRKYLKI